MSSPKSRQRPRFHAAHSLAILVVAGCFTLMALGKDGIVHTVLLTVTVFYFGRAAAPEALPKKEAHKPESET